MITLRMLMTEAAVLAVFPLGLFLARRLGRGWHLSEIVILYGVGLLFEILTAHMWTYHHVFLVLPTPIDSDISLLFPLGWVGFVLTATALAEYFWKKFKAQRWWVRHGILMLTWLPVGLIGEIIFYRIGMIEYIDPRRLILGQLPFLPPTLYLIGYAITPPFFSQFLLWLERDLSQ